MARYDEVGVCEMVDYMCLKMEVYQLQKKKRQFIIKFVEAKCNLKVVNLSADLLYMMVLINLFENQII